MNRQGNLRELMDSPGCQEPEMRRALGFLRFLNRWSLARWMLGREVRVSKRLLDVATGAGDIPDYLHREGIAGYVVGLDRGAMALGVAAERSPEMPLVRADCRDMPFGDKVFDTAICHLFFHHLDEDDFVAALREMDRVSQRVVVMDLVRSRSLFWTVRVLTWFSGCRISRHDGPVSVQRSYSVQEVESLVARSGVQAKVKRRILGRWCLRSMTD